MKRMRVARYFCSILLGVVFIAFSDSSRAVEIATFSVDVTPPLGHQLVTGRGMEATGVDSPLFAKGFVLIGQDFDSVVFVSVDWAEIRNEAYDRWRDVLAKAAGTERERVLVTAVHQHDTPLADLGAQRILTEAESGAQIIDLDFHERTVQRVADALRGALEAATPITHVGTGEAEVADVASNRRYRAADGSIRYSRYSGGSDLAGRIAGPGTIDPMLKLLSFWNGDKEICALSLYATHPMSYYGTGKVSSDFPGIARERRQEETPGTLQIYASGASGNVTVGKFNDQAQKEKMRQVFADRLHDAMQRAAASTVRHRVGKVRFRNEALRLPYRTGEKFSPSVLRGEIDPSSSLPVQAKAALGLSWHKRCESGQPIDVPLVDFGFAQLLLLPAEIYVEYQLFAQDLCPDSVVMVAGYGECGPGYIPVERAWEEEDQNLDGWCWIDRGVENLIEETLRRLLKD